MRHLPSRTFSATGRVFALLAFSAVSALADDPAGTVRGYFNTPGLDALTIRSAALDSANGVVAVGSSSSKGAFRLKLDGTKDTAFGSSTYNNTLNAVMIQADGRILVGGLFTQTNSVFRPYVTRLTAAGVVETSFPTNIGGTGVQVMAPGAGGKFYLGKVNGYGLQRYSSEGVLDNTFLSTTLGFGQINGRVTAVRELANGSILVAHVTSDNSTFGSITGYHLDRVSSTGVIDPTFTPPALDRRISNLDILPDNRIAIVGEFTTVAGLAHSGVAILGENGALDGSFSCTLTPTVASDPRFGVKSLDDRLYVYGDFSQVNGVDQNGFARINLTGSLDTGFPTGTDAGKRVDALLVAPDGDLFIGGNFRTINTLTRYYGAYLARGNTGTPPADPFADYLAAAGVPEGMRGPTDDPDGDGILNLMEYALGLNPTASDVRPLAPATAGANLTLTYRHVKQDVTYSVETTANLTDPNSWTATGVDQGIPAPDGTTVASVASGPETRFLRLKVSR